MTTPEGSEPTPKMLVIENFVKPLLPIDMDEDLQKVMEATIAIQAMECNSTSQEELHQSVKRICSRGAFRSLYHNIHYLLEMHFQKNFQPILQDNLHKNTLLRILDAIWTRFCHEMRLFEKLFQYLDEVAIPDACELLSIWDLGLYIFDTYVMSFVDKEVLVQALKELIEEEEREKSDQVLSKNLFRMLSELTWNDVLARFKCDTSCTNSNFN